MFFEAVVDEVAGLREVCAVGDSRDDGWSGQDDLYFPAVVVELARDYACVEDGFVFEVEEGFFESVAAFLSFGPVAKVGEFFFDGFEDVEWFVLVFGVAPESGEHDLLEVHFGDCI